MNKLFIYTIFRIAKNSSCAGGRCNPSSWSSFLEYFHNSLVSASTRISPFMASLGYQPPLFKVQEEELMMPSVQANLRLPSSSIPANSRCRPLKSSSTFLSFRPGVWLSFKDLPLLVESSKLALQFIGPFEMDRIMNP